MNHRRHVVNVNIGINNLVWYVRHDQVSGIWSGACPALRLTAQGDSHRELREDIDGAMQDLFRYLVTEGKLESHLRGAGWALAVPSLDLPKGAAPADIDFDVPYSVMDAREQPQAHAA